MIQIHPTLSQFKWKCPACGCQLSEAKSIYFQGQHILADITCTCCEIEYFQTYPVGHGAVFPVSFSKAGEKSKYEQITNSWMEKPLIESMVAVENFEPRIESIIYKEVQNAIVLNCLDSCWGHVLMKMLNAHKHIESSAETGLVLLIPNCFKWLVPEGIAEAWIVDAPLQGLSKRISNIDVFVKTQFDRFVSVSLSEAFIRPDLTGLEISKFTKTNKFAIAKSEKYTISFVWREDRFWQTVKIEEWLYLASIKFKFFNLVKMYFAWRQMNQFNALARRIYKQLPNSTFKLIGIGKKMTANHMILDVRKSGFTDLVEKEFCEEYARSHVVVGVHGSNMLLPTALAGGFVDLVPSWKLDRWGEDIAQPFSGGTNVLFGRCLEGLTPVKKVAKHVLGILENHRIQQRYID